MNGRVWLNTASFVCAAMVALTSGCATLERERSPVPRESVDRAEIPGIPGARYWGDVAPPDTRMWVEVDEVELRARYRGIYRVPHAYLAISGGGANGAYGAGVLAGWSARGDRPKFAMVTGISTGSIIAPFAFLGSEYDPVLEALYGGNIDTEGVLNERSVLTGLRSDAFTDTAPLRALLEGYLGEEEIEKIAAEHRLGRRLYLGTVNIDTLRPVTWDIGLIAASGAPGARELVLDIILASAAIPVAFPPVFIDVEVDGVAYQEMHVDGGLASQVFVYPSSLDWQRVTDVLEPVGAPKVYVIRNAKIEAKWEAVDAKILPLAERTIASLIRTQGIGDLEEILLETERDGLECFVTFIPAEFDLKAEEAFDPVYMKALYDLGGERTRGDEVWSTRVVKSAE